MTWDSILPLAAVTIAFIAALGGFFAWVSKYVDKRHAEHLQKVSEVTNGIIERLNGHREEFERVQHRIEHNEEHLRKTREELYEKFVRNSELDKIRDDLRSDFNNVFQKMGGISRALNQLIGVVTKRVHDE